MPHRNKINNEELRSNKNAITQIKHIYSKNDSTSTINKFHVCTKQVLTHPSTNKEMPNNNNFGARVAST